MTSVEVSIEGRIWQNGLSAIKDMLTGLFDDFNDLGHLFRKTAKSLIPRSGVGTHLVDSPASLCVTSSTDSG